MLRFATFGDILIRLSPPGFKRLSQTSSLEINIGGAEANVAVALSQWKNEVQMISAVPDNDLGKMVTDKLSGLNVDIKNISKGDGRIGLYFLEPGTGTRGGKVTYDRQGSLFSIQDPDNWHWPELINENISWFHWSGITPALTESSFLSTKKALEHVSNKGITVSVDLNYRGNLWKWGKDPIEVCPQLVAKSDIIITNEEATRKMLGLNIDYIDEEVIRTNYDRMAGDILDAFPMLKMVFIPIRRTVDASENYISLYGFDGEKGYLSTGIQVKNIVDRVGAGDAMTAAIIHGISSGKPLDQIINLGVAASALKHSIPGDFLISDFSEVESIALGNKSKISR
ncbi:sugar kinase [Marinigracilibium pacificum]|uniref:Sugar kinase n=1 Tax=Marinigracilibium pacificum TaxID=2729599 RepID=A0A848J5F0_9BACT|nr:sugar kinase [Marinigracilibium pacificum]NMM49694.1 sugar kinase [Marinigracilibium pacificum]